MDIQAFLFFVLAFGLLLMALGKFGEWLNARRRRQR